MGFEFAKKFKKTNSSSALLTKKLFGLRIRKKHAESASVKSMYSFYSVGLPNHFDNYFAEIASVHKYQTRLASLQKYYGSVYFTGDILAATNLLELLCRQSIIRSRGMTQY